MSWFNPGFKFYGSNTSSVNGLLSSQLLARLQQLQLLAKRRSRSNTRGERRSRARGQSVEFADHRNYSPGDDLRYLDWNLYGRLDRLFLKLYEEERELPVLLLLDASQSMDFGEPTKFHFAKQIVAALGFVALNGFDHVRVALFPSIGERGDIWNVNEETSLHELKQQQMAEAGLTSVRGKRSVQDFLDRLSRLKPGERGGMNEALRTVAFASKRVGMAIVVSDFLDTGGYEDGLGSLIARGFQVTAIQVLAQEEWSPNTFGDLKVVDSETGVEEEVSFGPHRLKAYQASVRGFVERVSAFCVKRNIRFFSTTSDSSLDKLLLEQLRASEVVG